MESVKKNLKNMSPLDGRILKLYHSVFRRQFFFLHKKERKINMTRNKSEECNFCGR